LAALSLDTLHISTLAERLQRIGFHHLEDLGSDEINARYFKDRTDGLRVAGSLGRLICAGL